MARLTADIINPNTLTKSEMKVLKLLCEGYMRKEIARLLYRSYGCISKQIESIAAKLDAHSAAEIVAVAVAEGLVNIHREQSQTAQTCRHINSTTRAPPTSPAKPDNARPQQNQ